MIALVLKTRGCNSSVGSNPTPSSMWRDARVGLSGLFAKQLYRKVPEVQILLSPPTFIRGVPDSLRRLDRLNGLGTKLRELLPRLGPTFRQ